MSIKIAQEKKLSFKDRWNNYSKLYWNNIFKHFEEPYENLFSKYNIILWGWVPYLEYEKSNFYNKSNIKLLNKEIRVYYYLRYESNQYFSFFFVNTIDSKNLIIATYDEDLDKDRQLIKKFYQYNLSIHKIFNHVYSLNCWQALVEEFS